MTIHITNTTDLIATWKGSYMYIPEVDDILIIEDSFYRVKARIFTKEDVRLEVIKLEVKTKLDGKVFEFQKSL